MAYDRLRKLPPHPEAPALQLPPYTEAAIDKLIECARTADADGAQKALRTLASLAHEPTVATHIAKPEGIKMYRGVLDNNSPDSDHSLNAIHGLNIMFWSRPAPSSVLASASEADASSLLRHLCNLVASSAQHAVGSQPAAGSRDVQTANFDLQRSRSKQILIQLLEEKRRQDPVAALEFAQTLIDLAVAHCADANEKVKREVQLRTNMGDALHYVLAEGDWELVTKIATHGDGHKEPSYKEHYQGWFRMLHDRGVKEVAGIGSLAEDASYVQGLLVRSIRALKDTKNQLELLLRDHPAETNNVLRTRWTKREYKNLCDAFQNKRLRWWEEEVWWKGLSWHGLYRSGGLAVLRRSLESAACKIESDLMVRAQTRHRPPALPFPTLCVACSPSSFGPSQVHFESSLTKFRELTHAAAASHKKFLEGLVRRDDQYRQVAVLNTEVEALLQSRAVRNPRKVVREFMKDIDAPSKANKKIQGTDHGKVWFGVDPQPIYHYLKQSVDARFRNMGEQMRKRCCSAGAPAFEADTANPASSVAGEALPLAVAAPPAEATAAQASSVAGEGLPPALAATPAEVTAAEDGSAQTAMVVHSPSPAETPQQILLRCVPAVKNGAGFVFQEELVKLVQASASVRPIEAQTAILEHMKNIKATPIARKTWKNSAGQKRDGRAYEPIDLQPIIDSLEQSSSEDFRKKAGEMRQRLGSSSSSSSSPAPSRRLPAGSSSVQWQPIRVIEERPVTPTEARASVNTASESGARANGMRRMSIIDEMPESNPPPPGASSSSMEDID